MVEGQGEGQEGETLSLQRALGKSSSFHFRELLFSYKESEINKAPYDKN